MGRATQSWTLLAAIAVILTGCPGRLTTELEQPLTSKEREALELTQLALDIGDDEGGEIWPGYRPGDYTLLIFRPGQRSFLINPRVVTPELTQLEAKGIRMPVYAVESRKLKISAGLPFAKEFPVAGNQAFLVRHRDNNNANSWFRLLVHELFHEHQRTNWKKPPFPEQCRYPYHDETNVFIAHVEALMLAEMLTAPHTAGLKKRLATYAAIRNYRYGLETGEAARQIEEWEERVEGSARYVEEMYTVAARKSSREKANKRVTAYLKAFKPRDLQKWKYYRTGLALAFLAEAAGIEGWKEQCAQARCLFPFLLEQMAPSVGDLPAEAIAQELQAHEDARDEVADKLGAYLEKEEQLLDNWQKQGRFEVKISFPTRGGAYYTNRGTTFSLPDCSRMVSGILSYVDRLYGLDIRNRGVIISYQSDTYYITFKDDFADGSLELDSSEIELSPGAHPFVEAIRAKYPGWSLIWQGRGQITVEENNVDIQLEDQ